MPQFTHLHCHTQYSILDGAANIKEMVTKAAADNMPAVAITDHGNMFGVFEFIKECNAQKVKPIVGCEFYMVEDMSVTSFAGTGRKDKRYHQLLLAKNEIGYKNLTRLTSMSYKEGLYGKFPRIDLELLKKHKEGLIATTCCIGAIVPQTILMKGEEEAEKVFKQWLDMFGEDYYIELQRHNIENINGTTWSQEKINQLLLKWANRYNVKAIATNDSHYVDEADADVHDVLLCINTGNLKSTPIKTDEDDDSSVKTRFGFANNQFFFKTTEQMETLFKDVPHTLDNTNEIVDKVESLNLLRNVMMPNFAIPDNFQTQSELLRHLVYEGAKQRYGEITSVQIDRIELELKTILDAQFEGYFLVIEDFLREARRMKVSVGPGRGSAAGSVVAYCLGITQVDPLSYGLLFERFLNPERVSFPDIDIDFEDEGRQKVLDYVVDKYGRNNVAQIITYGTLKEKSAIRDVARVLDLPLRESDLLAKSVPDNVKLKDILNKDSYEEVKKKMKPVDVNKANDLLNYYNTNTEYKNIIDMAVKLRGSVRNTGVHACGVIIAPEDLQELIPLSTAKDNQMSVTQYDNSVVEKVGLLKMDFLGLKTLSIIKDILYLIKKRHNIDLDIENVPLDDALTFQVFQKAQTDGIFQFESDGMKKSLIGLKPDRFFDLIAMNALYRPGPLDYIPNYINRKHGREAVVYDIDASKEILEETYGIMVYQEQVMQLSQKLANFTKGQADSLRKAMGKKIKPEMDKLYPLFIEGCKANGHPEDKANKIWTDMEKFAEYAFNKSHSTCYALVAYQSAYLKAHYPAEFMAGLMSNNMDKLDDIKKYIEESKRMDLNVLGPDVNESEYVFIVNAEGNIRFGLSAIKGVGENVIKEMSKIREEQGRFTDIFDFVTRLGNKLANKKVLEALAISGALDGFTDIQREQYFVEENGSNFVEKLTKYANTYNSKNVDASANLFGESFTDMIEKPKIPKPIEFSKIERLRKEQEVIGIYLSGHPLDPYRKIIEDICIDDFKLIAATDKPVYIAGILTRVSKTRDLKDKETASISLEGFKSNIDLKINAKNFENYEKFLIEGKFVLIKIKYDSFTTKDGKVQHYNNIMDFMFLDAATQLIKSVHIRIFPSSLSVESISNIKQFIEVHKGRIPAYFEIVTNEFDENLTLDLPLNMDEINDIASSDESDEDENTSSEANIPKESSYKTIQCQATKCSLNLTQTSINELIKLIPEKDVKLMTS